VTTPAPGQQGLDPDTDPRVAATVHLLHRRRSWAWTLGGSLVAFVAFVATVKSIWPSATGAVAVIGGVTVILLLALAVVALTAVVADTVRLRRREPSIRAQATSRTSYHPGGTGRPVTTPAPGQQGLDPDTDPRVAATVHLLHRRRGWAWTLGGSLVALVAFVAILASLWPYATGALETISGFIIILLLALAVVAVTAVITDTVRLRRREPSIRAQATSRTSYHPAAAYPFSTPVRHRTSRVLGWVALAMLPLATVVILPDQVNAFAYVAGEGKTVTFLPQSTFLDCGRFGCHYWTDGVLQTNPPVSASWPNQVPLGQPFSVRQPVWNGWGSPDLMNGVASGWMIAGGLVMDLATVFLGVGLVHVARRRLERRREAASMIVTAP
jgi:hypothetical protein